MDREQLMLLSDKELRIEAAELMGAKWYAYGSLEFGRPAGWHEADGSESLGEGWNENIPDYPNDIEAAMGLAEKIADRYWLSLHTPFRLGDPFFAGFTPLGTTGWNGVPDNKCPGDKAGQAIARAFILAMTETEIGN